MARSSYIYIAVEHPSDEPVAAFTVKWEMENWLTTQKDRKLTLIRMRDGGGWKGDFKPTVIS